ncbi:hypothetical protein Apa02nite_067580 [Actinoplanes palleronii]|uniref:Uncharacterized protein n=1 Tax=Actinoplanes palleronii TaxID=113570 RepID=A0ABQ4BJ48_9ACTN|nr:hypothetical protein Apa02nite_067580 [Actinoplanes palleronii]
MWWPPRGAVSRRVSAVLVLRRAAGSPRTVTPFDGTGQIATLDALPVAEGGHHTDEQMQMIER